MNDKTYKFAVTINDNKKTISTQKGVDIEELAPLIQDMKKAIESDDDSYCTLYKISNHGYTPNFVTNSKKQYENFINLHQNILEKPFDELRKKELKYAQTLQSILRKDRYLESFGIRSKPIAKITPSKIDKPVDTYSVIKVVSGVISEMGSPDFKKRTHIFLDGHDYKIYTTDTQDEGLKTFYRSNSISLKVKQKRSVNTNRIISATLIDFTTPTKGSLIENVASLSQEDLSFLKNTKTHEDILKLIRV